MFFVDKESLIRYSSAVSLIVDSNYLPTVGNEVMVDTKGVTDQPSKLRQISVAEKGVRAMEA